MTLVIGNLQEITEIQNVYGNSVQDLEQSRMEELFLRYFFFELYVARYHLYIT